MVAEKVVRGLFNSRVVFAALGHRRWLLGLGLALVFAPSQSLLAVPKPITWVRAQQPLRAAPVLPPDRTTPLPRRSLDAARLRELRTQREFNYVETKPDDSFWTAFWARIWRWLARLLSTPTGRFTWKWGIYAAIVAALVFAVLKLLQVEVTGLFGRRSQRGKLAYDIEGENIHAVDFSARISEAEAAGNYRLATRLGYLEVLKFLTDAGHINWQPDKTNHAYLAELPAGPLRDAFREGTRQFEYVWYGELRLSPALYEQVRAEQRAIGRLLTTPRVGATSSTATVPA